MADISVCRINKIHWSIIQLMLRKEYDCLTTFLTNLNAKKVNIFEGKMY